MKYPLCLCCISLVFLFISPPDFFSKSLNLINRIEGQVYDQNRMPVPDANVELMNDVDSLLSTTKTNASGRFSFFGVSDGHFRIKVLALKTNLMEQTQDVEIVNLTRISSDTAYVEFYLRPSKRASDVSQERITEAIFVQEIPQNARRLYETGIDDLGRNQDKGLSEIEQAVGIFPEYFDALSRLGREYISRKDYDKAYPFLLKAIDVNPRSYTSFYSLAYAFYQMKQIPAAVKAAAACVVLDSSSSDAQLLYGTLLRLNGDNQEAEKTLLKAKSLAKKPNPEISWQLALLYNKLKRNKQAADELQTYLKIYPDSPDRKKVEDLIAKLKTSKDG